MGVPLTQLIPVAELPRGQIAAIRNAVIEGVVALASKSLYLPPEQLVVRDIRPREDLTMYGTTATTTATTVNDWIWLTEGAGTAGWYSASGTQTMTDGRFIAIYGVKDLRLFYDLQTIAAAATSWQTLAQAISQVKITVGGGDRVIWDTDRLQTYFGRQAGISPTAVVIPQNVTYNISYYKRQATASILSRLVLDGIVVEPRGKLVSP